MLVYLISYTFMLILFVIIHMIKKSIKANSQLSNKFSRIYESCTMVKEYKKFKNVNFKVR